MVKLLRAKNAKIYYKSSLVFIFTVVAIILLPLMMSFCDAVDQFAELKFKLITICQTGSVMQKPKGLKYYSGSLYFADAQAHVISKCDLATNQRSIVAGSIGYAGFVDDQNQAALFNSPTDVWAKSAGLLYVADTLNNRIRKIENGQVTTFAGDGTQSSSADLATNPKLNHPQKLFLVGSNLYYGEGNNTRKIPELQTNQIVTIMGSSKGFQLLQPTGLHFYSDSSYLIADSLNDRIISVDNNVPKVIAGLNTAGAWVSGTIIGTPSNVAAYSTFTIFTDSTSSCIRKIATDGTISTIAGICGISGNNGDQTDASVAKLRSPYGLTVSDGNIYFTDEEANLIRVLQPYCDYENGYTSQGDICLSNGYPVCYEISGVDTSVCSGNGDCTSYNTCKCRSTYSGTMCQDSFTCSELGPLDSKVCSSHGSCIAQNKCNCNSGYYGATCSYSYGCNGIAPDDKTVCSGQGSCTQSNTCKCNSGYTGTYCENEGSFDSAIIGGIIGGVVGVIILVAALIIILLARKPILKKLNEQITKQNEERKKQQEIEIQRRKEESAKRWEQREEQAKIEQARRLKEEQLLKEEQARLKEEQVKREQARILKEEQAKREQAIKMQELITVTFTSNGSGETTTNQGSMTSYTNYINNDKSSNNESSNQNTELSYTAFLNQNQDNSFMPPPTIMTMKSGGEQSSKASDNTFSSKDHTYKIIRELGRGGFGVCYLCADVHTNDMIAVKAISATQDNFMSICSEFSKCLSFQHPNLVRSFEYLQASEQKVICLAMKYYKCGDLDQIFKSVVKNKPPSDQLLISIINQVGEGLDYLHRNQKVIHRDIKANNIMVDEFDEENSQISLAIGDFGVSKQASTAHTFTGTLYYVSPELYLGKQTSYPTDIFSFGVTLYLIICDKFKCLNQASITQQILGEGEEIVLERIRQEMKEKGVREDIIELVMRMLAKDPEKRPLAEELAKFFKNYIC